MWYNIYDNYCMIVDLNRKCEVWYNIHDDYCMIMRLDKKCEVCQRDIYNNSCVILESRSRTDWMKNVKSGVIFIMIIMGWTWYSWWLSWVECGIHNDYHEIWMRYSWWLSCDMGTVFMMTIMWYDSQVSRVVWLLTCLSHVARRSCTLLADPARCWQVSYVAGRSRTLSDYSPVFHTLLAGPACCW
jgi:hypothetical protein